MSVEEAPYSNPYLLAGGVVAITIVFHVLCGPSRRKPRPWPRDVVILHQFPRGRIAPSVSPFPIKLETYLRMNNIAYENDFANSMSKKRKCPWITYNGKNIADSQFCIDYLNKEFGNDTMSKYSPRERAEGVAFRKLVEESLYWIFVTWSFQYDNDEDVAARNPNRPPWFIWWYIARYIRKSAWTQGTGRHSREEVIHLAKTDLTALSDYLGTKKYILGDEPCDVDCSIFGMLAQVRWHMITSPIGIYMRDNLPNLWSYCDRMKDKFWPDWDECTAEGSKSTTGDQQAS